MHFPVMVKGERLRFFRAQPKGSGLTPLENRRLPNSAGSDQLVRLERVMHPGQKDRVLG